ncbi:radical SAM protein [Kitasatospora sp. NPDC048545]|uniref:radical SAM protein n=1 Tax=Kitasatospora sp. NPDC048545 TaxID=3157208 RepID=UPI0033F03B9D
MSMGITPVERREFAYQGERYTFRPNGLQFEPVGRSNERLANHFESVAARQPDLRPLPKGGISFITLNVAHDCNMACPYCFAKQGLYGGRERKLMDEESARRSVDWLFDQAGEKPEVYLRFLGGEPLMNVPVIRKAAEYAEAKAEQTGKRIYMSINTNGTLYNAEIAQLLKDHRMTVSISMDGTRAAHNTFRVFRNGKGTYDAVVRNVKKFLEVDPDTMINATLTAANLDVDEYAALFRDLGVKMVRFAMVGTAVPEIAVAKEEKLAHVLAAYDRLARSYRDQLLSGDVWYLADFYKYFANFRNLEKRHNRCGAGTAYVNVDVDGNVNLCHRFTTDGTQRIGKVASRAVDVPLGIRTRDQLQPTAASVPSGPEVSQLTGQPGIRALKLLGEKDTSGRSSVPAHLHKQLDGTPFFNQSDSVAGVVNANVCAGCDIRYVCGGSCFHDGEILYGDLFGGPDGFKCEVDRHLAKISMWLLDSIFEHDPVLLDRLDDLHLRSQQHHAE